MPKVLLFASRLVYVSNHQNYLFSFLLYLKFLPFILIFLLLHLLVTPYGLFEG